MTGSLRQVIAVCGIAAAAAGMGYALRVRIGEVAWRGVVAGVVLAAIGAIAGVLLTDWAFGKEPRVFFAALGLGLLGRLFLFCGALLTVALRWQDRVDATAMAVTLLGLYVVFQVMEVRLAITRLRTRNG